MKKLLLILLVLSSCNTIKVTQQGEYLVRTKPLKKNYPQKTTNVFISGHFINPEVWVTRNGKYFYYKDAKWLRKQKRVKLKIKKQ